MFAYTTIWVNVLKTNTKVCITIKFYIYFDVHLKDKQIIK